VRTGRISTSCRIIAAFTLITFVSTSLVDPAWAQLPRSVPSPLASFSPFSISVPTQWGSVKKIWFPDSVGAIHESPLRIPQVIYIADAHTSYEAQRHIARLIRHFRHRYNIQLVCKEGNEGPDHIREAFTNSSRRITHATADLLLKKGRIDGSEFGQITSHDSMTLWGVEDFELYKENLKVFREILEAHQKNQKVLSDIFILISQLKQKIYPKDILTLEELKKTIKRLARVFIRFSLFAPP
jgi:hypothetical protein